MEGIPAYYDYINAANSQVNPSTVHCNNTALSNFFERYLLQRAISVFEWDTPEFWPKNYYQTLLYCWGYFAVVRTDKYGVIPQGCGLGGYNVFYQPMYAIITNPLIDSTLQPMIDVNCTLFRLQPNYCGIMDIVSYYANMMALASESIGANLVNSKLAYTFVSKNKSAAESFKKMYDQINGGNPAAFIDKDLLDDEGNPTWMLFNQNLKQTYITTDLLTDLREIRNMFDTEIGIPNANISKKERLIVDEANANNFETKCLADTWLEEIQKSAEKCNRMFGTNISVKWRDMSGYNVNTRNVSV